MILPISEINRYNEWSRRHQELVRELAEKARRELFKDPESVPLVSIGPSGLGGPYQREWWG